MATSGTVATTVIDTATLLEHAVRRAGISATKQTPELISAAKQSVYLLLLNLSNKGLKLWCLERFFQGLVVGQTTYTLPVGTINLLSAHFSKPSLVDNTQATVSNVTTVTMTSANTVARVGIDFDTVTAGDTLTVDGSTDGVTWTTLFSQVGELTTSLPMWFQPAVIGEYLYVRVTTTSAHTGTVYVSNSSYDLPMTPWSRDVYMNQSNKLQTGSPSTNYFFDRLMLPQVTIWPVPTSATDHLFLVRHRQVQDVGTLSEQLEVPQRWLEGITWQAAFRVAVETEGAAPDRIALCKQMCDEYILDPELEETDGMPVYFAPNVSVYSA